MVQLEGNDWIIKNEGAGREDVFQVAHPNGFISEENGAASCGDALEMLNYGIADYLSGIGNDTNCLSFFKSFSSISSGRIRSLTFR